MEEIRQICDAFKNIPIIANGGSQQIKSNKDIEEFRLRTGASRFGFTILFQFNIFQ
jgi:tRNA-dihydrouridine synthase